MYVCYCSGSDSFHPYVLEWMAGTLTFEQLRICTSANKLPETKRVWSVGVGSENFNYVVKLQA